MREITVNELELVNGGVVKAVGKMLFGSHQQQAAL